ncbi:DNA gyrase inhibitor YacG [Paracidobacterium acidisoli]|uniref:DNA gyrase inhibitor YacG n=1 Tax=Paracidobacterium acidisoli TaxID=2303751 RepID=A0A372ITI3_9BACT|nr:DNA gyrase inhibitor YacG [Paracidobacterium acidisoli]MBT9329638.1 DNA gyrase inhibitor YacG [Paracidobacterium acidisoli]
MTLKNQVLRCPTCRTLVTAGDENFPFCSDRCRAVDLGKWASGVYRISSPVLDPEVLEGAEAASADAVRRQREEDET